MTYEYRRAPGLPVKNLTARPDSPLRPKKKGLAVKAAGAQQRADPDSEDIGRLLTLSDVRDIQEAVYGPETEVSLVTLLRRTTDDLANDTSNGADYNTARLHPEIQLPGETAALGGGHDGTGNYFSTAATAGDFGDPMGEFGQQPVQAPEDLDELTLLSQDTPLSKLKAKEQELVQAMEQGLDSWHLLRLQQEMLALAKLHTLLNRSRDHRPLLLPSAHYQLAERYCNLGCHAQAAEHLDRAMEELPVHGQQRADVQALRRNIQVSMAVALMQSEPPKPKPAIDHLFKAAKTDSIEEIKEVDIIVLLCQCFAELAEAKLHQARGTRVKRNQLSLELDGLDVDIRKAEAKKRVLEVASLQQRYSDKMNEERSEEEYEARLVEDALQQISVASDALINCIVGQEQRLESAGLSRDQVRQTDLVQQLYRRCGALLLKEAECHGLKGNTKEQERALKEILSNHEVYQCFPQSLLARVRRDLGIALVQNKKYDEALDCYQQLSDLQRERFAEDYRQLELACAECYKLCGDVFVARREFNRAREHFALAYEKYVMELGPMHKLALDLEHRLQQLEHYDDAHALLAETRITDDE